MDWVGHWFQFLEERGESSMIQFGSRDVAGDPREGRIDWNDVTHQKFDGVGWFWSHLSQSNLVIGPTPLLKKLMRPRIWKVISFIVSLRSFFPKTPYAWIVPTVTNWVRSRPQIWAFTDQETQRIHERAKCHGVSVNTYLLYELNGAVGPLMVDHETPRIWMVPVNMRTSQSGAGSSSNFSSYLLCKIREYDDVWTVHQTIKQVLASGFHWSCWRVLNVGRWGGDRLMRLLFKIQYRAQSCIGIFSNLGEWSVRGNSDWFFAPPNSEFCPIAAGSVETNGRLTLALHIHPSKEGAAQLANAVLQRWRLALISVELPRVPAPDRPAGF